ncbi:MAG: hypothetical protein H0W59_04650 [Chloroflexia bacterium]|nr:hypothetical protein [Chloroflexia bacterium]
MTSRDAPHEPTPTVPMRHTVVGLYEDRIDAEHALEALRKGSNPPDSVSLLMRDKGTDGKKSADRAGAVASALVANALESVGDWLYGLAALIVPERGTFLVAGPIGAALAGISADAAASLDAESDIDVGAGGLHRTIREFGFTHDEATYLESRLTAGVALLAVTTDDRSTLLATRRTFADQNAVYIGMAQANPQILSEAFALLNAPPESSSGGDVVVTDAVAPLRRISSGEGSSTVGALHHRDVVDAGDEAVGRVEEVIIEGVNHHITDDDDSEHDVVRYLVIGFGGLFGIGRHQAAVPAELADLTMTPIRLSITKALLERAPHFDHDSPFSRREERALCGYFGTTPYWESH